MVANGHRMRVLVVEDDDDTRELLAEALAPDYDVRSAPDARAGLAQLQEGAMPDVLLTDESLPGGMRGVALAREVKARSPTIRVILFSGHPHVSGSESADLVLRKPIDLPELFDAISSVSRHE